MYKKDSHYPLRSKPAAAMIDYDKFRLSLKRLEEQHENHLGQNLLLSDLDREGIAESVIQRFETCYDCLWKVLKKYLTEELGIAEAPNSPKPVLRMANENDLLVAPLTQWFRYADARIDTSHDYDGEKAKTCLSLVQDFLYDAICLYETMSGATWE